MKQTIQINGFRSYAYHGVLPEEQRSGAGFELNLKLDVEATEACRSDVLSETVNYAEVVDVLTKEMAIRADLIEHLAFRIASRLFKEFKKIKGIRIEVIKPNAPVSVDVDSLAFELSLSRLEWERLRHQHRLLE
ncbi:MAG: dihydroneopterin aldolase [Flavobacteriales bacterium]